MFEDTINKFNLEISPLPIDSFIFSICLSFVLSYLLGKLYRAQSHCLSNPEILARIFPILSIATTIVIAVVKSSLALSLGLVGALSIVRFRTPVKEPEELTYIFLCIGIGLSTGAEQYSAAVIGLILTTIFTYFQDFNKKNKISQSYIRVIIENFEISDLNKLIELISRNCKRIDFHDISLNRNQKIGITNLSISILPRNFNDIKIIANQISEDYPESSFTILDSKII